MTACTAHVVRVPVDRHGARDQVAAAVLDPDVDVPALRSSLESLERICAAAPAGGPAPIAASWRGCWSGRRG